MELRLSEDDQVALVLELKRDEIPVFRALLERAGFVDTRPQMQSQVMDLIQQLLEIVPES